MNKSKKRAGKAMQILKKVWRVGRWVLLAIVGTVVAFVVINGIIYYPSIQALENIKNTRLTMADVTGETLPVKRSDSEYTATLIGLDENANGIRDDVEHAIFAMTDDTLQMRAAKLQYAQALHLYFTDVRDGDTLEWLIHKAGFGRECMRSEMYRIKEAEIGGYLEDGIEKYNFFQYMKEELNNTKELVFNTSSRKKLQEKKDNIRTYINNVPDEGCHVIINE